MSFYSILALLISSARICEALVPYLPRATQIQDPLFNPLGFSPRPTAAPKVPRELFYKRDFLSNSASYVLVAPDQTCGYVSGLPGKIRCSIARKIEEADEFKGLISNVARLRVVYSFQQRAAAIMAPWAVAQIY